MKTVCYVSVFFFWVHAVINAQIVNEEVFPRLPYPNISAEVLPAPNGFYFSGLMSNSTPYFDGWQGSTIPFFLLQPESPQKNIVLIPDTAHFLSYAFSYNHDEFTISPVVGDNDSMFVAWSKITQFDSDVPPTYYINPNAYIAKFHGGEFEKILSLPDGLNPSAGMDNANTLHFIWEKVVPLSNRPLDNIFSGYRSTILYQSRNQDGQYSDTLAVGNGLLPKLLIYRNTLHCVFFQVDSSSQTVAHLVYRKMNAGVFEPPIVLYEIRLPQYFISRYRFNGSPLDLFTWGVDSLGGVHCGWRSGYDSEKIYVLHYQSAKGIQIDSSQGFYVNMPKFRFMPDGEVRVFAATQDNLYDRAKLRYSISRQGTTAREAQVFQLTSNSSLITQLLIDNLGQQHALVTDFSAPIETYLIKNIGTGDTSTTQVTKLYLLGSSSYVDKNNRTWLTGKRDSTTVILNFLLNDVGKAQDFSFPLNVGNRWYYRVTNIEDPDPVYSFRGYDSVKADMDTVVANRNKYIRLSSSRFGAQFVRKDGFRVYQYSPKDTAEFLRFDFSAHEGDTIAFYGNSSYRHFSILMEAGVEQFFGIERRLQRYQGFVPGSRAFETSVIDSLGIIRENDGLANDTYLVGARINGTTYGRIPGNQSFYFPLAVGNEWYYQTYSEPPNGEWPTENIVKATRDTLMPNGRAYVELVSKDFGTVYWRRGDLTVSQYVSADSSEFTRFDFTKASRETVDIKKVDNQWRSIVIDSIYTRLVLGKNLLSFRFIGDIENSYYGRMGVDVSDSLGITHFGLMGPESFLIGAKIDGKTFGTVLHADAWAQDIPLKFSLSQNYPNPFNPTTSFQFTITELRFVSLKIYDLLGKEVETLVNEGLIPGSYSVQWDATKYSTGVYFYQLRAGVFVETKKMLLMK